MLFQIPAKCSTAEARSIMASIFDDLERSGVTATADIHVALTPYAEDHRVVLYNGGMRAETLYYSDHDARKPYERLAACLELKSESVTPTKWRLLSQASEKEIELLRWLEGFARQYLDDDMLRFMKRFVLSEHLLPDGKMLPNEFEKGITLRNIVELLERLLGSRDEAANWLLRNPEYRAEMGVSIWDELESGDLHACLLLEGFLKMALRQRNESDTIFEKLSLADLIPFAATLRSTS
jgi:hypothetical protein